MDDVSQRLSRSLWVGIGLLILVLGLAYLSSRVDAQRRLNRPLPVLGPVADFTLTNQNGTPVTLALG